MRRIQPNGCGYDGFVCKGLTRLRDIFMQTPVDIYRTDNPTDDDWVWTNDTSVVYGHTYSQQQECVDNYAQVPQSFEGFVMTLTPVIDMSGGTNTIEVPEIACRTNMDPFTTELSVLNPPNDTYTVNPNTVNTGLIDLYNQVPKYNDDVYAYIGDDREQQHLKISIKPAYKFTIGPGLLEPMLDTMFPPVGVDTITSPDTLGDFTVWLFNEFNTWKGLVDDRLRNLYQVVPHYDYSKINGLLNLEDAKNREGGCSNFNIHPTYSVPVIGVSITAPLYSIDSRRADVGGKIKVDGQDITVLPLIDEEAPFDAYLDIFDYTSDGETITGATITTRTSQGLPVSTTTGISGFTHKKFEYIGSVRGTTASNTPEATDYTKYTLYEIEQGDCIYEISLSGGTGGGGGTCTCDPYVYYGPFMVTAVAGTTIGIEVVDVSGIDGELVSGNWQSRAGYVCYNGTDCSLVAGTTLNAKPGDDIWAAITVGGISYYVGMPPTTTPPSYDVRLARIHSFATSYTTELDPTYMAEEPDFDAKGMIKPVLTTGTTTAIAPGGDVEYDDEAEIYGSTGSLLAAENGVIWEVIGNTCTGYYQTGGTASFSAVDDPEVTQIHHGDIHVDGRWS
jgi:hypothetical protein